MTDIAAKLARVVHNMRCTCVTREHWPWKAPRKCARCEALDAYNAAPIIQTPEVAAEQARAELMRAAYLAGDRNE